MSFTGFKEGSFYHNDTEVSFEVFIEKTTVFEKFDQNSNKQFSEDDKKAIRKAMVDAYNDSKQAAGNNGPGIAQGCSRTGSHLTPKSPFLTKPINPT